jgi:hypothetical protein
MDDIRRFPTRAQLAWVERTVGAGVRVTGGRRMLGGISSSVHCLSLRLPTGASTSVVLKRFIDPGWDDVQAIVQNEAAAIAGVETLDAPTPRLLGVSPDGAETDGAPSLLMTRAAGRVWLTPPDLDSWIRQLATLLPTLHAGSADVRTRQRRDRDAFTVPEAAARPDVWTAARRVVTAESPPAEPVLTHGDYQHFNVLWSRGRLSALVDWSFAQIASPDLDVGHCRLNLAVLYSPEIAERFRRVYESEAGRCVDPWWDIHQLLAYSDEWPTFIPVQVAGRAPVELPGMTGRVEQLLAAALARM